MGPPRDDPSTGPDAPGDKVPRWVGSCTFTRRPDGVWVDQPWPRELAVASGLLSTPCGDHAFVEQVRFTVRNGWAIYRCVARSFHWGRYALIEGQFSGDVAFEHSSLPGADEVPPSLVMKDG